MKHPLLALLLLAQLASAQRPGHDYAVFFYVTDFKPGWPKLPETATEATQLKTELETNFGFSCEAVSNPSKAQILAKIKTYNDRLTTDDQVLFFFSMHGHYEETAERGFLIAADGAVQDDYGESWLSYDDLSGFLARCKAKHVLLALDVCHSGAFGIRNKSRPDAPTFAQSEDCAQRVSRMLQYAGRQYCSSGNKESKTPAKSLFASRFLEALRKGGEDGIVRFDDLEYYLGKVENPRPESGTFKGHEPGGDFVFVRKGSCKDQSQLSSNSTGNEPLAANAGLEGNFVLLETTEDIYSETATVGGIVSMRVRTDVKVGNATAIRAGALAIGRVKSIQKATYNDPECIILEPVAVQASDGQQVSLLGSAFRFCGEYSKESMRLPAFQLITATIYGITKSPVKEGDSAFIQTIPVGSPSTERRGKWVLLSAGTVVSLALQQGDLDWEHLSAGAEVDLICRMNITVNGLILVTHGAIATGRIEKKEKAKGGILNITIGATSVMAVDGQRVNLSGGRQIIKVKNNQDPFLNINFSAQVSNDIKIHP